MSEPAKLHDVVTEPATPDPIARIGDTNRRLLDFMFGAQAIFLEEIVFVANEMLDRTRTETHLYAEFISKLAGARSVNDWGTMCRECCQHQLDFFRRDCDRLFGHGERMIGTTSRLVNHPISSPI